MSDKRSEGERTRARHQAWQLTTMVESMQFAIDAPFPSGTDGAQAVVQGAVSLAMTLAKLDAYLREEAEPLAPPATRTAEGSTDE